MERFTISAWSAQLEFFRQCVAEGVGLRVDEAEALLADHTRLTARIALLERVVEAARAFLEDDDEDRAKTLDALDAALAALPPAPEEPR